MAHKLHEPYSAAKPVPKIALKSLLDPREATETKAKHIRSKDKKAEQDKNATEKSTNAMVKGKEVKVKDPVTWEETTVKHGGEKGDETDDRNKGKNVLDMDFPPPNWMAHRAYVLDISRSFMVKIISAYVLWPVALYFISNLPLIWRVRFESYPYVNQGIFLVISLFPPSILAYTLVFALDKKSTEDFGGHVWDAERRRGLAAGEDQDADGMVSTEERIKESAEWLNAFLRGVWPIMNPDLFASGIDMLEDIMQASCPKFIHAVRIADLGQGTNPPRITSIRALPDMDVEDALKDVDENIRESLTREHVNLEVSFAYRALPSGAAASSKAHNAHLLVEFFLGVRGAYEFNFPVWVELTGVSVTSRARLELIPDPPFIKTTLVTFMGLPRVSISVVPMSEHLPNVMNIPVLSSFISKSIDAACAEYVAPRSLALDLQQIISGDDIKKDTEAIGVIVVHIQKARGLKKMDTRTSAEAKPTDPYVTVVYSRQGKPLYSTRIIFADTDPCYEETAVVTVDANAVKIREKLSLQLWDSDRASADDMMGFVEVDLLDLLRNKNTPSRLRCSLTSPDSEHRPGHLEFTAGYYSKMWPDSRLATDGSDPAIPEDLKEHDPNFQEVRSKALNDLEAAVLRTPPSQGWPSGILSIQVHEIRDLKIRMEGRDKIVLQGRQEGAKGQDDGGEEREEGPDLPSSYCTISLNDNLIYSTRVKPITSTPIFNAGTERFVRDWRTSYVTVTVRDSRMRENDPILGIVFLKLSDLFVNASEVTRFFPIENGIGYGSARVSVLFRPVGVKLPRTLLGFDVGTLVIRKLSAWPVGEPGKHLLPSLQSCEVKMKVSDSSDKVPRKKAEAKEDRSVVWNEGHPLELPVGQRYNTALRIKFEESGGLKTNKLGMAVLWLCDIVDNEDMTIDVALFKASNYDRLKQNYVPHDGNLDCWETGGAEVTRIGTVRIDLMFKPGMSPAHRKGMDTREPQHKRLWEEADRRDSAGYQAVVGYHGDGRDVQGDNTAIDGGEVQYETENGEVDGHSTTDNSQQEEWDDGDQEGRGIVRKFKDRKKHEKELHQQHRGIMQMKPARTTEWLKDNVEEAGLKVKNRFKMKSRQPDVETEV